MQKNIQTSIIIKSSPDKVWEHLIDLESYPLWNPFIIKASGKLELSSRLNITVKPYKSKPSNFRPKVITMNKNRELRWLGSLPIKKLFDGEHYFILTEDENGFTKFTQGEKFSGVLIRFFHKLIDEKTLKGFELMNQALKEYVES